MVDASNRSSQMCGGFSRRTFLISGLRNRFRMSKGRFAVVVAVKEDTSPSYGTVSNSTAAGVAVNESVSDCGGNGSDGEDGGDGGGDDSEGGDDDGEPPTHTPMPATLEWWQISAIAAVLMTSTLLICWIIYR